MKIIHLDMDAFYASVEERDNPSLKGHPVIVGGLSDHGVVTTANYVARKYGIHSAMPIFKAKKLCPNGYYISPRISKYGEESRQVFNILYEFTDLVEQVSIDEAYLDVSHIDKCPLRIVREIKEAVFKRTGLTMSVGISYNKFLAKLASDWNKPNGIKIISPHMIPEILLPLSVKSVHGIGPKSAKKLNNIGIYTIRDLILLPEDFLIDLFGKSGRETFNRIRGIDHRVVDTSRERKSLGTETTLEKGTWDKDELTSYLGEFSNEISNALIFKKLHGRTISLKVKYANFTVHSRSRTLSNHTNSQVEIFNTTIGLLDEISLGEEIRLIGLSISNLISIDLKQLSLFNSN